MALARPGTGMLPPERTPASMRLGVGCDIARRARDHHADGIEQVPSGVIAHFVRTGSA